MTQVKILGAGSIGNHLAHASRKLGWQVTLCDIDPAALDRTRKDIYPARYGSFDESIALSSPEEVSGQAFDIVIIGTPPDSHVPLALAELEGRPPKLILIEKPLCPPDLAGCDRLAEQARAAGTRVLVGYNHRMTEHTLLAGRWLSENPIGPVTTLRARFREHWGGIFDAHPWLDGPADTYLGFTRKGGGALGEHSHAINIWQYFAELAGLGRITEVTALLDEVENRGAAYDRIAQLSVRTESGVIGTIVQDVVTRPAQKWLRMEGRDGYLEWEVNATPSHDRICLIRHERQTLEEMVEKSRPDDFRGEIEHLGELLENPDGKSPLDLGAGMDTMRIIEAAIRSSREGRRIRVDYDAPTPDTQ